MSCRHSPQGSMALVRAQSIALSLLLTTTCPFGVPSVAVAQPPSAEGIPATSESAVQLYVNPRLGSDRAGDGSQKAPLRTITHALEIAQPNTVIQLAEGLYSAETGETFPLQLKPGVTLRGDPETRGLRVVIQGGGRFVSPTAAVQNVAIVALADATLTGVTVINSNPRGLGLWIESGNPVVTRNTFTRNRVAGISVNGSSAPQIGANYFYNNIGNGIVLDGTSRAQVQDNVLETTGYGVSITENAAPRLVGNTLRGNRVGAIAQGNSQPIFRNNRIAGSREGGLVAISNARPDLGTPSDPGGNIFRYNRSSDLKNLTQNQIISAFGNQISTTEGRIEPAGSLAATPRQQQSRSIFPSRPPAANSREMRVPPSDQSQANRPRTLPIPVAPTATDSPLLQPNPLPAPAANSARTTLEIDPGNDSLPSVPTPTPRPTNSPSMSERPSLSDVVGALQSNPNSATLSQPRRLNPNRLPVPDRMLPPVGNTNSSGNATAAGGIGARYRVLVETPTTSQITRVRSLIPNAFRTSYQGKVMMQVGVFNSRTNAEQIRQRLDQEGLNAIILSR